VEKLAGDGKTKYSQSTLNYYVGPINKEVKSRWIMHEITIPDYENEKLAGKKGDDGEKDMVSFVDHLGLRRSVCRAIFFVGFRVI
jgi:predicted Mrr-cat superfamily restriction endonuclease